MSTEMKGVNRTSIMGIEFWNTHKEPILEYFKGSIHNSQKISVAFVDAHCFLIAQKDDEYKKIIEMQDCVLPDGAGVRLGCKLIGTKLIENLNGTDLFPHICKLCEEQGFSIFFLGGEKSIPQSMEEFFMEGEKSVAHVMSEKLRSEYPELKISGFHHGFFDQDNCQEVIELINRKSPDFLLVALGVPLQEKWIFNYKDQLNAKVSMGVGGLFDFYSGKHKRAPMWMRNCYLEWLYRLNLEPLRLWKRYLIGNPLYVFKLLKWIIGGKKN